MRSRRIVLCTIAVGLVTTSASALAAPVKPVCQLVKDVEGDGRSQGVPVFQSKALDILSADVASGKNTVVGTIRLKTTQTSGDSMAALGMRWSLAFQIAGTDYSFTMQRAWSATGASSDSASSRMAGEGGPTPTLKVDATSITWTVPRSAFASLKKPKMAFSSIAAGSNIFGGNADSAIGGQVKYTDLTPSCLKPA